MKPAHAMAACFVVLASAVAYGADPPKLPFTISKETTGITAPLKADGTPNYVAALNEKYGKGVTPENNGYVAWLRVTGTEEGVFALLPELREPALKMVGMEPLPADGTYLKAIHIYNQQGIANDELARLQRELNSLGRTLWKAADHPQAATFLKEQDGALDRLVAAAEKTRWWVPLIDEHFRSPMLVSVGMMRYALNLLAARATQRAEAGNFDGFQRDVLAIKRMGRLVGSSPMLMDRLGAEIDGLANDPLGAAIGSGRFSEAQCKGLDERLQAVPPMPSAKEPLQFYERWSRLEFIQSIATGRGWRSPPDSLYDADVVRMATSISPADVDWDVALKLTNEVMDRYERILKEPSLKTMFAEEQTLKADVAAWVQTQLAKGPKPLAGESRADFSTRAARATIATQLPGSLTREEDRRRNALRSDMAHLLLLAAQVKAKTGRWPATLNALTPGMIKEIPKDLYPVENPGPLQYTVTPAGAIISTNPVNGNGDRLYVGAEEPPLPGVAPGGAGGLP